MAIRDALTPILIFLSIQSLNFALITAMADYLWVKDPNVLYYFPLNRYLTQCAIASLIGVLILLGLGVAGVLAIPGLSALAAVFGFGMSAYLSGIFVLEARVLNALESTTN